MKQINENNKIFDTLKLCMEKTNSNARYIDSQVNILLGISSAVFIYSISKASENSAFFIMGLLSAIASIISILAIHPPRFIRGTGGLKTIFYNKTISNFNSSNDYKNEIIKISQNKDKLIEQFTNEIYNLSKYYYQPKRKLFHFARNVFLAGILLGLVFFIIGL